MADSSLDSKVGVKVCRLFDLGIAGNFPLLSQIPETQGPPELIGELSRGTAPQWENLGEPAFESLVRTSEGEASILFYRTGGSSVMRFADGAEFRLRQNRIEGWTGGG